MDTGMHTDDRTKRTAIAALVFCTGVIGARPHESPFVAECRAAMSTMMSSMTSAMRNGAHDDADAGFAAMMIPHHEGAMAMARAELRYGKNEQLRRLAQEIIITQQQEIVAMRMAASAHHPTDSTARNSEP